MGSYKAAKASTSGSEVQVYVDLNDVSNLGLTTDTYPFNYVHGLNCTDLNTKSPGTCAWAAIQLSGVGWVNATVGSKGQQLLLEVKVPTKIDLKLQDVLATAYGWG